jgi:hypothetical protein
MRRPLSVLIALVAAPVAVFAQSTPYPECNKPEIIIDPQNPSQPNQPNINICNAAVDGAAVFHPVAGLLVSGGNPVLGSFKGLGGLGHFRLTARMNATRLRTPDLNYRGTGGTTVPEADKIFAPAPLVEAAIGVFPGMNGLLSIDVLGSAQLIPTTAVKNLTVAKGARKIGDIALGLGYGLRVGVLPGKAVVPSVTVSVMRRDIPRITYGNTTGGDTYSYGLDLHATNLRAVAGYKLTLFTVGAGLGWDKYTGDARVAFKNQAAPGTTLNVKTDLDNSRTMAFLNAGLDFPVVKIVAEAGYQFGKDQKLKTTFTGNDPSDSRLFVGAGVQFAF